MGKVGAVDWSLLLGASLRLFFNSIPVFAASTSFFPPPLFRTLGQQQQLLLSLLNHYNTSETPPSSPFKPKTHQYGSQLWWKIWRRSRPKPTNGSSFKSNSTASSSSFNTSRTKVAKHWCPERSTPGISGTRSVWTNGKHRCVSLLLQTKHQSIQHT